MFNKLFKYLFLLFLTYLAIFVIIMKVNYFFIDRSNNLVNEYVAINDYEKEYPLQSYVNESFDTYPIVRRFIASSMYSYEDIVEQSNKLTSAMLAFQNFFNTEYDFLEIADSLQYVEEKMISLNKLYCSDSENYYCEYEYVVHIPSKEAPIKGLVKFFYNGNYSLVVSFDKNYNTENQAEINTDLAQALSDDSTAETLAYFIVEVTQSINKSNMEPNEASKYYYGCDIKQLAGSISYHALIAYILESKNITDENNLYDKVLEVNVTKGAGDDFFVNRNY